MQLRNVPARDALLAVLLFAAFLTVSIPGVSWGTPAIWNPDELVARVALALNGELEFDQTEPNFNSPSLPKYVMYGVGRVVYSLGYDRATFIITARVVSAILGGLAVVLAFLTVRLMGGKVWSATLAGQLMICSGVIPENARFAHNDLYLLVFVQLCVLFALEYQITKKRGWLYACFYSAGLAASSKYTGGSMLLLPLSLLFVIKWDDVRKDRLAAAERGVLGLLLTFLGYATGTPRALLWMSYYFKRVLPALLRYPQYGLQPDSQRGWIGQWGTFEAAVGPFLFVLFLAAALWVVVHLAKAVRRKERLSEGRPALLLVLFLSILFFDLPFLASVNYIPRYFIPFVALLAVATALFLEEVRAALQSRGNRVAHGVLVLLLAMGLCYSFLRVVSTALLFTNDARAPAGEYLGELRPGSVIEYTLYPPVIPPGQFAKARNYPIFFLKYPGEIVPTDKPYDYNAGEAGLLERGVDYLVVDSFTYARFTDPYVCSSNPVECEFFGQLLAGRTQWVLLRHFEYSLPTYLPQLTLSAVNPAIRVYEHLP